MDAYQKMVLAQFFESLPNSELSQVSCDQFVLHHIPSILFPKSAGEIDVQVQPNTFQGSMSYTAVLHAHSTHNDHRIAVQFRSEKLDLFGVCEANRIHGPIVPLVTYQGIYEELFVYTSPFTDGTPYISILMSSEEFQLPLQKKMATAMDLADLVTRGARATTTTCDLTSTLNEISHAVNNYIFQNTNLRTSISTCINKLLPQLHNLSTLPHTLTHQDLTPFNYLIDDSTGHIEAILDWDGALYLPVGSNFHFMNSLFGSMTLSGWRDAEDRQELETVFYDRALASLAAQGLTDITKEQLELQKTIGMLLYGVKRLLKLRDKQSEHYLEGYLQGSSLMSGLISLH